MVVARKRRRNATTAPQRVPPTDEGRESLPPGPRRRNVLGHPLGDSPLWRQHHHDMISLTRQRAGWYALMADDISDLSPGRMDDGFLLVARDLFRAFVAARLLPPQLLLVEQAIEESYGKARLQKSAEPFPFRLNVSKLARVFGCRRAHLADLHSRLVKAGIFVKDGDLYRINKDYRLWRGADGSPALSAEALEWCVEGKTRRPAVSSPADRVSATEDTLSSTEDVLSGGQGVRYGGQSNFAGVSATADRGCPLQRTGRGRPPRTPHRGTGAR